MVEASRADVGNMLLEAEVSQKNHSKHSNMLTCGRTKFYSNIRKIDEIMLLQIRQSESFKVIKN